MMPRALGDAYVGDLFPNAAPAVSPKQPTPREYCESGISWECRYFPLLTNTFENNRCNEAWDLYDACMAGVFPRHLAAPPGAPKAPELAAKPGVNYNDPEVQRSIQRQNEAQSVLDWEKWKEANRKIMTGDAPDRKPSDENWVLLLALGVVVLGMYMAGGMR